MSVDIEVKPCSFCGLPILKDHTNFNVDGLWHCFDLEGCFYRAHIQVREYSPNAIHADTIKWYRTILKDDPHFAWRYHFRVCTDLDNGKLDFPVFVDGPWNVKSFPTVVNRAYNRLEEYLGSVSTVSDKVNSISIHNMNGDVLFESRKEINND